MKALLEITLNPYQKEYIQDMKTEGEFHSDKLPNDFHDEVFARYNNGDNTAQRIILPMAAKALTQPNVQVLDHLAKHNITVHDYANNIALQKIKTKLGEKVRPIKISKALEMTNAPEELKNAFAHSDKRMKDKNLQLVISRNPEDIGGMSTGVGWVSCQTLPAYRGDCSVSEYHRHIVHDFQHKTLAVFVTPKGDDNIESPISRTLLKRFINESKTHSVFRTTGNFHGSGNAALQTVQNFCEKNYPFTSDEKYKLALGLYPEGKKEFSVNDSKENGITQIVKKHIKDNSHFTPNVFGGNFEDRFENYKIEHNTDEDGELHSDENTPAIRLTHKNGRSIIMHMYHGALHHDIQPAIQEKDENGNIISHAYFKYGKLHSPQDGTSSVMTRELDNNGSTKSLRVEWHKFGMLHTDLSSNIATFESRKSDPDTTVTTLTRRVYGIAPVEGIRSEQFFHRKNGMHTHIIKGDIVNHETGTVLTEIKHNYKNDKLYQTTETIVHPQFGTLTHIYSHDNNIGTVSSNDTWEPKYKVYYGPYLDIASKFRGFDEKL